MNFNNIHGTDRTYACITRQGKCKNFTFAIAGYGAYEKKKEERFSHLLSLFNITYCYRDVRF
jgi:hypothetical protein